MRKEKMSLSNAGPCWQIPDELWVKVQPLLPPGKPHPLGCHRPRVNNRKAMDAISYRLDKGYDYDEVRELGKEFGYTLHIRARKEESQAFKRYVGYKARRWVVERTHSWMNRFRAVLIRWDKKVENYLTLLHLACAFITYRAVGLLG